MGQEAKLKWRCRRGTKELDLVLTRFLEREYPSLSSKEQEAFEKLLVEQDPDLAAWLWGGKPSPEHWQTLIARIRATCL